MLRIRLSIKFMFYHEHTQSVFYFSPSDEMLLWNGVLWDHRSFTSYTFVLTSLLTMMLIASI